MTHLSSSVEEALWSDWIIFLRAHKVVVERISGDLTARGHPSLVEYSVLWHLREAAGHRLRLSEVAEGVLVSKSRLSRLINDLASQGFVRRERDVIDKRVTYAVLTEAGLAVLRSSTPAFGLAFNQYFASHIEGRQGSLTQLLRSMASQWDESDPQETPGERHGELKLTGAWLDEEQVRLQGRLAARRQGLIVN